MGETAYPTMAGQGVSHGIHSATRTVDFSLREGFLAKLSPLELVATVGVASSAFLDMFLQGRSYAPARPLAPAVKPTGNFPRRAYNGRQQN